MERVPLPKSPKAGRRSSGAANAIVDSRRRSIQKRPHTRAPTEEKVVGDLEQRREVKKKATSWTRGERGNCESSITEGEEAKNQVYLGRKEPAFPKEGLASETSAP